MLQEDANFEPTEPDTSPVAPASQAEFTFTRSGSQDLHDSQEPKSCSDHSPRDLSPGDPPDHVQTTSMSTSPQSAATTVQPADNSGAELESDCQAFDGDREASPSSDAEDKTAAEHLAAAAMEALNLAAASGASGGSVPFGSPVHARVRDAMDRPSMSNSARALPFEGAAATEGSRASVDSAANHDELQTCQLSADAVARQPLTLGILGGNSRGIADGEESDWGSASDMFPSSPGRDDDHCVRATDGDSLEQHLTNGDSSNAVAFMNGDSHLSAEERLQRALARIAQLEDQNVVLWEELHQDESEDTSELSDSPTAAANDGSLTEGGSASRAARLASKAGRFSQQALNAKEDELKELQQRCMQFEVEVEMELEDLNAQLFKAQQQVHAQQQAFTESEAKRQQMQSAKQMVEAQLQETGQQLMECEALLVQAGRDRPARMTPPKREGSETPTREGGEGSATPAESPGTPALRPLRTGHPFFNSLLEAEVEQLKEENETLMTELVGKKMALAELSESYARVKRDLHRRESRDRAHLSKMSRIHAILGGEGYLTSRAKQQS